MGSTCAGRRAVCGTRPSRKATGRRISAEDHPLRRKGAAEHQRQLPGDLDQEVVGGGIVGGPYDPVIEGREMRQRPRHVGDLARDLADLFRHREQELCAKAVGRERDRRFLLGRGGHGLLLTRHIRDRAQRIDHLRTLLVVLERLQRPLGFLRRQCGSTLLAAGGSARTVERDEIAMKRAARSAGASLCDTRIPEKAHAPAESGPSPPKHMRHVGSTLFARGAVSEVGQRGDILLAFAAMQDREPPAPRGRSMQSMCDAQQDPPVIPGVGPE